MQTGGSIFISVPGSLVCVTPTETGLSHVLIVPRPGANDVGLMISGEQKAMVTVTTPEVQQNLISVANAVREGDLATARELLAPIVDDVLVKHGVAYEPQSKPY